MAPKNVYLIDDDEDDREIFQMAIRSVSPEIVCFTAANGHDALEELNALPRPDYIFIDLNMPRISGRECLKEVRDNARLVDSISVIYTTSSHSRDIDELKQLGANHYLVKPDSFDKLIFKLREILSGNGLPYFID